MRRPTTTPALLSLIDSQKRARNLVSWSAAQRTMAEARLLALLADWRADWDLPAPEIASGAAQQLGDADARQMLSDQLFGPMPMTPMSAQADAGPSVAQVLASQAWDDWQTRLGATLGNASQRLTSDVQQHRADASGARPSAWDACLDIDFPWWNGRWSIRLEAANVTHVLGMAQVQKNPGRRLSPSPVLVPVTTALADWPLKVKAQFAPVSLTLGQIQFLRVGDVIPLSQRLDEPANLLLETNPSDTTPFCAAWLGQRQGRMAAELSAMQA